MAATDVGFLAAMQEGKEGLAEGGIPVGGSIVSSQGELLGVGRNGRIKHGSVILHGETAAFENAKHLPLTAFKGATLYTTLSPCPMCAGAAVFFKVARVVIGDNWHMSGREDYLRQHGIEVVVLNDPECVKLMDDFMNQSPHLWEEGDM